MKIEDFAKVQELEGKRKTLKDAKSQLSNGGARSIGINKNSGGWSAIPVPIGQMTFLLEKVIEALESELRELGVEV